MAGFSEPGHGARRELFVIAGPTAVGKSAVAVAVAERVGGEIIGADAFQVYRGYDILTAKPPPELRRRVPHHLIGVLPPETPFDVAKFRAMALEVAAAIRARGHLPLLVGGSGLYLRAVTHGLADLPAADPALRARLAARSTAELVADLERADPAAAASIGPHNRRRLIRALEVGALTGRPFSAFRADWQRPSGRVGGVLLTRERDDLRARINARASAMFAAGVVAEVAAGPPPGPTLAQAIGFREIRALLGGTISPAAAEAQVAAATRRYAKRQLTWFRRETMLTPINLSTTPHLNDATAAIEATIVAMTGRPPSRHA